jgi:hypothetical protein
VEKRVPWHGGSFDLPDEPTDGELRRALRVLVMGGSLGGSTAWALACVRWLRDIGPSEGAERAYERVAAIGRALQPPPTGVLNKAGRGLVRPAPRPHGRVGDIVPADATDAQLRDLYGPDADVVIEFRRQLDGLSSTGDEGSAA